MNHSLTPLKKLLTKVSRKNKKKFNGRYQIPTAWLPHTNHPHPTIDVNPYQFWQESIEQILNAPATPLIENHNGAGSWSRYATIYNLFVRSATAFDHNNNGRLDRPNEENFAETGSFMKTICLLPYIKKLGCNTIHLLPITSVGKDGNKGDAGSPYAIRNPYELDHNLAEPNLGLGAEAEFAAFVAAAHHLGLRVVMEFVFRTASKDCDWVADHPDWFYWLDNSVADRQPNNENPAAYGMPLFSKEEATFIKAEVKAERFDRLIPPHPIHRDMFLPPPAKEDINLINGRWLASYPDGRTARIPGAFADWPVDDSQPPWGDVTYLRLYDHPDYNYIGYNTIRMYSTQFAQPDHIVTPLWDTIVNIIPHYQQSCGIDGAMIDMGHALPMPLKQQIVAAARQANPDFAFWDENFELKMKSVREGYNAVMGELPFIAHEAAKLDKQIKMHATETIPLTYFGGTENHNTPRAASKPGGLNYSRFAFSIASILPTIPFIHNGFELGELIPINTGLGFTKEEIAQYPSETLPLFSAMGFDWHRSDEQKQLQQWIQKTNTLRQKYAILITDRSHNSFSQVESPNPHIKAIIRHTPDWSTKIALLYNQDMEQNQATMIWLPTGREFLLNHYTDQLIPVYQDQILVRLLPGECYWLEL